MSNEPKPGVIGSLPLTRPHRRSDKRPAPAGAPPLDTQAQEAALVTPAAPPKARSAKPSTARATKPVTATPKPAAAKAKPAAAAAKAKPAAAAARPNPPPPASPATAQASRQAQARGRQTQARRSQAQARRRHSDAARGRHALGAASRPAGNRDPGRSGTGRDRPARQRPRSAPRGIAPAPPVGRDHQAYITSFGVVAYTAPPPAERPLLREGSTGEPLAGCRRPAGANRSRQGP